MARGKKNGGGATQDQVEQSGNLGSNSKERAAIISEAVRETVRLKGEKAAIQELITAQRGRIKSLGIAAVDFAVALRLYELEVEDRNSSLDGIRECCEALGIGQVVDWVNVVEKENAEKPAAGLTAEFGREAYRANKRLHDNPHKEGTPSHAAWAKGFMEEQTANAMKMGKPDKQPAATH